MQRALFDRPLHRDVLAQIWVVVVGLTTLWSARGKVELGAPFNPDRAAAFVQDAVGAAAGGLLAILLTALVRRLVREEWTGGGAPAQSPLSQSPLSPSPLSPSPSASPSGRGGTTLDGIRRRYGRRGREWTDAEALRADIGDRGAHADASTPRAERPRRAPHVVATLDSVHTIAGVPVELDWRATDADHVLVSVLDGPQEPSGSAALHLEHGTEITVTAVNEHGSRTVRTPYVRVLPLPTITTLALPQAPRIELRADVAVAVGVGAPALSRLDAVLDEQAERRAERAPEAVSFASALQRVRAAAAPAVGWRPSGRVWSAVVRDQDWSRVRGLARACRRHGAAAVEATGGWLGRRAADLRRCGARLRRGGQDLLGRARALAGSLVPRRPSPPPPQPAGPPLSSRLATFTTVPSQTAAEPAGTSAGTPPPAADQGWWTPPPDADHGWWTPPPPHAPAPPLSAPPRGSHS